MANYDVLKELVSNGSNLILTSSINCDVLREIAHIASKSGAKLTVTTSMNYDVLRELSSKYRNTITFVDGINNFEKS